MAPPKKGSVARPGRALVALVVLIIVMLVGILGKNAFSPGRWHHDFKVQLGLDLSSGTSVTYQAQTLKNTAPSSADMKEAITIMTARVNGAGFSGATVQQQGNSNIVVSVPGKGSRQVLALVGTTAQLFFRQVLLIGASHATSNGTTPTSSPTPGGTPAPGATASPSQSSTPSHSSTSSPHAAGPLEQPGQTSAHLLAAHAAASAGPHAGSSSSPAPSGASSASPAPTPASTSPASQVSGDPSLVNHSVLALFNKLNCLNKNWKQQIGYNSGPNNGAYDNPGKQIVGCADPTAGYAPGTKFVLDKSQVLGKWVTSAQAGTPNQQQTISSHWQVNLSFNGQGTAAFGALTTMMNSKYGGNGSGTPTSVLDELAIVLDGQVVSAPNIDQGAITGGNAQITGSFTQAQATLLAQQLNYGALPVKFINQNTESITPSLGHDQLSAGLLAAAIGLGLVVVYSFLYYRGLGIVSVSSLIVASALAYFSVVLLSRYSSSGFSLSLAGIAGLIVAIGITADSFVVFFERLRDEVREGKSLRPAVESGWRRARRTILVSDTVSFLAALLLWYFSVSDVKGFAFTLGLTTIIDIIVVFLFTKPMVTILARTRFFGSGHPLSGLDPARLGARAPWRSGLPRTRPGRPQPARTREA
ncbi:MAG TPA: protein translocase subunit SecD [Streptosporangiaceae bacterium]|nr:protein translocase subunit SecD [Streptosporangiaceae bacterium]